VKESLHEEELSVLLLISDYRTAYHPKIGRFAKRNLTSTAENDHLESGIPPASSDRAVLRRHRGRRSPDAIHAHEVSSTFLRVWRMRFEHTPRPRVSAGSSPDGSRLRRGPGSSVDGLFVGRRGFAKRTATLGEHPG
jgi:hypothetical protein